MTADHDGRSTQITLHTEPLMLQDLVDIAQHSLSSEKAGKSWDPLIWPHANECSDADVFCSALVGGVGDWNGILEIREHTLGSIRIEAGTSEQLLPLLIC